VPSSIFSTYATGENRVTASILAVLQSLALGRTERLLGALLQESEFELLHFENQPGKGGSGVPDAVISGSCRILVETKTARRAVKYEQLARHLKRLDGRESTQRLLLLTPDDHKPDQVDAASDPRLAWANFATLDQAIDDVLADTRDVISEREAFLLRNLQIMLLEEDLLGRGNQVVVVPARRAWDQYLRLSAYVCQSGRPFQHVEYVAFYSGGAIQPKVPRVVRVIDSVPFDPDADIPADLSAIVHQMVESGERQRGVLQKVFLLSAPNAPDTITLLNPVENDLRTPNGRTVAFTQNQRYVSLERLRTSKLTSELDSETSA
jgi:hypothetical protein